VVERACISGDPLRDLGGARGIHVFGDARRWEAATTSSFQDPARLRPFLNQLRDTPTIQTAQFTVRTRSSFIGQAIFLLLWTLELKVKRHTRKAHSLLATDP
jgi:hypothetical protein